MKYRIKIETFGNGRKEYSACVKNRFFWFGLDSEGKTQGFTSKRDNRNIILSYIDLHNEGNCKSTIIDFEYINK